MRAHECGVDIQNKNRALICHLSKFEFYLRTLQTNKQINK